jgi:hypothetical protein
MGQGTELIVVAVLAAVFFFLLYSTVQRAVLSALREHEREKGAGR